jgi:hypothetical protein
LPILAQDDLDLPREELGPVSRPGVAKATPAKKTDRKRAAGDED